MRGTFVTVVCYNEEKGGKTMKKELLKGLTPEQIEKARSCKSSEELLALAKNEGIELSEEQLQAVSGGCGEPVVRTCPSCGGHRINAVHDIYMYHSNGGYKCTCLDCGCFFETED